MNSLIVLQDELTIDGTTARLAGPRAAYAYDIHELRSGLEVRCAVLNGLLGTAYVDSASKDEVILTVRLDREPPERFDVTFVVAIARPQTVKKVLQGAAMSGARAVHLVRTERSEKSYLQSKSMSSSEIERQLVLGLEQVWDSLPPTVSVHHSITDCFNSLLDDQSNQDALRIIADPQGEPLGRALNRRAGSKSIVLIGPEAGWTSTEVDRARKEGFISARIGTRIVRVEVALTYFIGVLQYEKERAESA